ncbi:MAG: hypothetical protein D9N11_15980 [Ketobacter sp.]|nr:MAG: hypothetical protein D9N11_15980 [Ketobacter sp.]
MFPMTSLKRLVAAFLYQLKMKAVGYRYEIAVPQAVPRRELLTSRLCILGCIRDRPMNSHEPLWLLWRNLPGLTPARIRAAHYGKFHRKTLSLSMVPHPGQDQL